MLGRAGSGRSAAIVALLVLMAPPLLACAPAAAGPQVPNCTIELSVLNLEAHPTSTTSDTVVFGGTVHVTFSPFNNVTRTVAIEGTVQPSEWGVSVDPASKEVTGQGDIPFNASVGVPAAELSSTSGRLSLRAWFSSITGGPTVECGTQANIRVAQYYGVNSDAISPRIDVETGPTGTVATVLVENLGNGRDSFRVELENKADLDVLGLLTTLPVTTTLDPGQATNITFNVNASSAVEERSYPLYITVTSTSDATVRHDTEITVKVTKSIITQIFDPSVFIVLAVVGGAAIGLLVLVRSRRRKRKARLAKRQLDRIRRQRRDEEAAARAAGGSDGPRKVVKARPLEAPEDGPP